MPMGPSSIVLSPAQAGLVALNKISRVGVARTASAEKSIHLTNTDPFLLSSQTIYHIKMARLIQNLNLLNKMQKNTKNCFRYS
jgi:hypothetical protein